jgi:hypothetical protein
MPRLRKVISSLLETVWTPLRLLVIKLISFFGLNPYDAVMESGIEVNHKTINGMIDVSRLSCISTLSMNTKK